MFAVNDVVELNGDPNTIDTVVSVEDRIVNGENFGKIFTLSNAGGPFTKAVMCRRWIKQ